MRIQRYRSVDRDRWDAMVRASRNGVFLFERRYMEYHADRFEDHSLVVWDGEHVAAIIPANRNGEVLETHGGLTFGGVISHESLRLRPMLELFDALLGYLRENGFRRLWTKPVPHIYHRLPAEEELYALFRAGARLVGRGVSATVIPRSRPALTTLRSRCVRKAERAGLEVRVSHEWEQYMEIQREVLATHHQTTPAHSGAELRLLAERFPDNIRLFVSCRGSEMLGGVVVYESAMVAHAQYIAASEEGRSLGATDLVMDHLLRTAFAEKPYFDFGVSTLHGGRTLNEGLAANKEGFGGRATVYDTYEIML